MKPEATALPGFEDVDFSKIEKKGKPMPDISPSNELEYLSEVIIQTPLQQIMKNIHYKMCMMVKHKTSSM